MMKLTLSIALVFASAAFAQSPDEEWGVLPSSKAADAGITVRVNETPSNGDFNPPPVSTQPARPPAAPADFNPPPATALPPPLPPPLVSPDAQPPTADPARAWAPLNTSVKPPETPNSVSMYGGIPLGQWKRGQSVSFGFPLITLRLAMGLTNRFDAGVGFDSFYGVMNELRLTARYAFFTSPTWNLAGSIEGGGAFFNVRANKEVNGPRWITGRRNGNLAPGLVASFQSTHARAARLYLDLRYMMTFDTEPFARNPLAGVPPSLVIGHNVLANLGAEIPLTDKTSFAFRLGLDFHLRAEDAPVMPVALVGLVTSI